MKLEMKEDRRVRKTKRALREGLAELLIEKDIQNITVRELADKVDIHRSTFYANYTDIYDLYSQIEDIVVQEISDLFQENPQDFFHILFKYISDNRQVCRMFLGKNVSPTFDRRLTALFKDACLECWHTQYGITGTADELEYYIQFYLSGCLAFVGKWVEDNLAKSADELVRMFADIDDNFGRFIESKFA